MSLRICAVPDNPAWKQAYMAAVAMILMSSMAAGQQIVEEPRNFRASTPKEVSLFQTPYVFIESDLTANGNGFQALSPDISTGIDMEGRHLSVEIVGTYDFARKTEDNDQVPNEKGRVREADAQLLYKFHPHSSWFVIAGASWEEASMTPYTKSSWSPSAGAGRDFVNGAHSWRFQVSYARAMNEVVRYPTAVHFTPGPGQAALSYTCSLCGNGVHGIDASLEYPSPASSAHWLLLMSLQADWFHETVTDPYNLPMTQGQKNQHNASGSFSSGLIYRFKPPHFKRTRE